MTDRKNEIETRMLSEFTANNIDDTPENRLDFLQGLQEGWREEEVENSDEKFEKVMYELALMGMIIGLEMQLMPRLGMRK